MPDRLTPAQARVLYALAAGGELRWSVARNAWHLRWPDGAYSKSVARTTLGSLQGRSLLTVPPAGPAVLTAAGRAWVAAHPAESGRP